MYGIAAEYDHRGGGMPNPLVRAACQALMVRKPGYRRRLALMADGWRRVIDLYLFTSPEAARAALAGDDWRVLIAAYPACRDAAPALLVHESPYGDLVVLLRSSHCLTRGGQSCWRDHLISSEPEAILW